MAVGQELGTFAARRAAWHRPSIPARALHMPVRPGPLQAYNNSWGYSDAGDKHGKLLPYWHKAFAGLRLDGADYAERLAELAEH